MTIYIAALAIYMLLHNFVFVLLLRAMPRGNTPVDPGLPVQRLSIVLPIYNEAAVILSKLGSLMTATTELSIAYEVLIGSDGSTDGTDAAVAEFLADHSLPNWSLHRFENRGKCPTVNQLVELSSGDLIVSTDADSLFDATSLQKIIDAFDRDQDLGCLSCVPVFNAEQMRTQGAYWKYELAVREAESALGTLIVSTGWLYAYRRELYRPIPAGVMADDLWIPLSVLLRGKRSVHDREVKALSEPTDPELEVQRRKRVISGGFDVVRRLGAACLRQPLLTFVVFSHKVNRWMAPLWFGVLVVSSLLLSVYSLLAYLIFFGVLALMLTPKGLWEALVSLVSPLAALPRVLARRDLAKWEHTRK